MAEYAVVVRRTRVRFSPSALNVSEVGGISPSALKIKKRK